MTQETGKRQAIADLDLGSRIGFGIQGEEWGSQIGGWELAVRDWDALFGTRDSGLSARIRD